MNKHNGGCFGGSPTRKQSLYLVSYCHPACTPMKSITALTKEDAFAAAERLSSANTGTAFNRFGKDFAAYYEHRLRAEQWLYDGFTAKGGNPQTRHPLYFVLEGSGYLSDWFGGGRETKIPLDCIAPSVLSFTFGDSMSKLNAPERRPVFTAEELYVYISECGGVTELLESIREQYTYIEAQLWLESAEGLCGSADKNKEEMK